MSRESFTQSYLANSTRCLFSSRFWIFFIAASSLLSSSLVANAADTRFTSIRPFGAQVGTEVEVSISGRNLDDVEQIMFHEDGISVLSLEVNPKSKGRTMKAKLKIEKDCRVGNHFCQLRAKTGLSTIQVLSVGLLPTIEEKEPNTDFDKPQAIMFNHTIQGRIDREDVDYYIVDVKKGERFTIEVEGIRLGTPYGGANFFDPYVAIMNLERFELAASDDEALTFQDGFASIIAPESGKYIVAIRDSSYNGGSAYLYRLHVGSFPRPVGILPLGGKPGEKLLFKMTGDLNGTIEQEVTLPSGDAIRPEFGVYAKDKLGISPTWNPIKISPLDNIMEVEPNNTRDKATRFTGNAAVNGFVANSTDDDYFVTKLKKGQQVEIETYARRLRSKIDTVIYIYNSKGKYLASDDDRRRPDSWMRFKAPADDDYYILIRDQLRNGGPEYTYRIEITPSASSLKLGTSEKQRYIQPSMIIPKGRRTAFLAMAIRSNVSGELEFDPKNLPEGVTLEVPKEVAKEYVIPIMLHAKADAKIDGRIAKIATSIKKDGKSLVEANLTQRHLRVRGRNQNDYVRVERLDTIPVVVTDHVPFDVKIVEPKVPLIQGSVMQLKVVATRDKGFDAPIKIQLLQNPSGVSSSRSVSIPKGKTEALIPLNASTRAAVKQSFITVRGTARVGSGDQEVFTPFAKIKVEPMYFEFKFKSAAAELGQETEMVVEVKQKKAFEGKAEAKLMGLPAKVVSEPFPITKDTKDFSFKIKIDPTAKTGTSKNLFADVTVIENGQPVLHRLRYGRLRIDRPLPKKKVVKKSAPKKKVVAKPVVKKAKPLSRLEQLRLQQKEKLETQK